MSTPDHDFPFGCWPISRKRPPKTISDLLVDTFSRIERAHISNSPNAPPGPNGLSTGLTALDAALDGLHPGDLVLLGSRPGMGRTSLALQLALHAAVEQQVKVAYFTTQATREQIAMKLVAHLSRIDHWHLRTGRLEDTDWPKLARAAGILSETSFEIHDQSLLSVRDIHNRCVDRETDVQPGLLIVDIVQDLERIAPSLDRAEGVMWSCRGLKIIAEELQIPVLACASLNRETDWYVDKRPRLSSLGDDDVHRLSTLEEIADVVLFLYRDEYYNPESADEGIAEVTVAKHRCGPTGTVRLRFDPARLRFDDVEAT